MPAGQIKNAAPSGARSAGQSASARLPAQLILLLIVTRMGRDTRPGLRQRIEQVARRVALLSDNIPAVLIAFGDHLPKSFYRFETLLIAWQPVRNSRCDI